MRKKIITLSVGILSSLCLLVGCSNKTNTEPAKEYVLSNDNVDVVKYKGLEAVKYSSEATEEDIDNYIQYIMNYTTQNAEDATEEDMTTMLTIDDLTDEMVKTISNNDYTTVKSYRAYIKGVIEEQNVIYYKEETQKTLFDQITNESNLKTYDEERLNFYLEQSNEYYQDYADYFEITLEEFYTKHMNIASKEEYENFVYNQALNNLKKEYIIKAIASAEKIEVTEEEIDAKIQEYIDKELFETKEEVEEFITREEIITNIKYSKILDLIYNSATFVDAPVEEENNNVEVTQSPEGGTITIIDETDKN